MRLKYTLSVVGLVLLARLAPMPTDAHWFPRMPLAYAQQPSGLQNFAFLHVAKQASDFTDGNGVTTLQNIPGLAITLPAQSAVTYQVDCDIFYSQATNVADNFGVQFTGNAPTNSEFGGFAFTNATAIAAGTPANVTNTTATNVVTMTPAVTTVLYAHLGGAVEMAGQATDTILNIQVAQSTAADVIVIKRDSVCRWAAMP